jgi:hypothetical protein
MVRAQWFACRVFFAEPSPEIDELASFRAESANRGRIEIRRPTADWAFALGGHGEFVSAAALRFPMEFRAEEARNAASGFGAFKNLSVRRKP